jgi:hypothetical protein
LEMWIREVSLLDNVQNKTSRSCFRYMQIIFEKCLRC